jgi:glycosyltransferase involved in cell wall biosynthesis
MRIERKSMVPVTAMIVFSYYPADNRVRREAEALAEAGISVDVICLRKENESAKQVLGGITVHRLPLSRKRASALRYIWEYLFFFVLAMARVSRLHVKRGYDVVHVHNMPDFLVFSALVPKLTGSKVILDLHDPMPEVYMTKYSIGIRHPVIWLLRAVERWSIRFSDLVLTPNVAFLDLFASRSCPESKIHVVMNSPDTKIFRTSNAQSYRGTLPEKRGFALMYHGTIVERHGLDTALGAMARIRSEIPNLVFHVYGEGDFVKQFLEQVDRLNLQNIVIYHGHVPAEVIAESIDAIDGGIIPNKRSVFTEINLPTRIFEYLCMGKPIIAPRTKGIMDYFDDSSIYFFEPGSEESLARVILSMYRDPMCTQFVLKKGMEVYHHHMWETEKQRLVDLVTRLTKKGMSSSLGVAMP